VKGTATADLLEGLQALADTGRPLVLLDEEWLTVPGAAEFASVSRSKLYEWLKDGLPYSPEPLRIRKPALHEFMKSREVTVAPKRAAAGASRATARGSKRVVPAAASSRAASASRTRRTPRAGALVTGPTDKFALRALLEASPREGA
jgi:hypothetical protein